MRRMLVSRSSLEKPRPFERCVRTSSPSSSSECRPRRVSSVCRAFAMVDLPAPDRPVNQTTNPWLIALLPGFAAMPSPCSCFPPVDAALLHLALLPPPPSRALVLARLRRSRAGGAADRRVAALVEGVVGHLVLADIRPHLVRRPRRERRHLGDSAMLVIGGDHRSGGAGRHLGPADAGDPRVITSQRTSQGAGLAHQAAEPAQLWRKVELVRAVG